MKQTITESQLKQIVAESVKRALNEISPEFYRGVSNKFYDDFRDNEDNLEKDKFGNPLDKKGRVIADRLRASNKNYQYLKDKEAAEDPLTQEAKSIWDGYSLENDIEWEDVDWGHVECEGWEFEVEGYRPEVETVSFKSPDGQEGEFHPNPRTDMAEPVRPVDAADRR